MGQPDAYIRFSVLFLLERSPCLLRSRTSMQRTRAVSYRAEGVLWTFPFLRLRLFLGERLSPSGLSFNCERLGIMTAEPESDARTSKGIVLANHMYSLICILPIPFQFGSEETEAKTCLNRQQSWHSNLGHLFPELELFCLMETQTQFPLHR